MNKQLIGKGIKCLSAEHGQAIKKYFGKGIKCLSAEHGQAIKKYFEDNGFNSQPTVIPPGCVAYVFSDGHNIFFSDGKCFSGELIDLPKQYWNPEKKFLQQQNSNRKLPSSNK